MNTHKSYHITVGNEQYVIVTDQSESTITSLASIVNSTMADVASRYPACEKKTIAVMTALQIAHALQAEQQNKHSTDCVVDGILGTINDAMTA
jgi:cell division protein ZapA (FtsZ GTPase activity inhibitor)